MKFYLTGFMGVGKTTIGREVSDQLQLPFVDLDSHIEQSENDTISNIFETKGEEHFRQLEKKYLLQLSKTPKQEVIALGGGTMCYNNLHLNLTTTGLVTFLDKDWEDIKNGLNDLSNRPLIKKYNETELQALYYQRRRFYAYSQLTVPINTGFSPKKVVNLLKLLTNR